MEEHFDHLLLAHHWEQGDVLGSEGAGEGSVGSWRDVSDDIAETVEGMVGAAAAGEIVERVRDLR